MAGSAILVLGVAAGIAVPEVYHLSPWLTAVVLLSLLLVALALGSYRVWSDTDIARKTAIAARGAAADQAQARLVAVWKTRESPIRFETGDPGTVCIHVENGSRKRISGLVFCWRQGTTPWDPPEQLSFLMPGKTKDICRELPRGLPGGGDKDSFSADVYFRDDNQVYWCATPREDGGDLVQKTPDQEPSPT